MSGPFVNTSCTVRSGSQSGQFPSGTTVSELKARASTMMDIDPQANAWRGNVQLPDSAVVNGGDVITFIRKSGEKGLA